MGHSTVSVTLDTHSYVKPGLVRQATEVLATLVARRTIGSGLAASADRLPERPNSGSVPWCRRRDSNPHGVHPQRFLRPPRLPFRHSGASSSKVYRLSSQTCTLPPPQPQRRTPAALHPPVSQATSAPLVALLARRHRTLPHQCWHSSHPTHDRQVQQSAEAWCVAHEGCGQDNGHPYLASGPHQELISHCFADGLGALQLAAAITKHQPQRTVVLLCSTRSRVVSWPHPRPVSSTRLPFYDIRCEPPQALEDRFDPNGQRRSAKGASSGLGQDSSVRSPLACGTLPLTTTHLCFVCRTGATTPPRLQIHCPRSPPSHCLMPRRAATLSDHPCL